MCLSIYPLRGPWWNPLGDRPPNGSANNLLWFRVQDLRAIRIEQSRTVLQLADGPFAGRQRLARR